MNAALCQCIVCVSVGGCSRNPRPAGNNVPGVRNGDNVVTGEYRHRDPAPRPAHPREEDGHSAARSRPAPTSPTTVMVVISDSSPNWFHEQHHQL